MPTQNAPTCMHPIEPSVSAPHATTPYGNLGIFCKHFFFVPFSCVFYFFFLRKHVMPSSSSPSFLHECCHGPTNELCSWNCVWKPLVKTSFKIGPFFDWVHFPFKPPWLWQPGKEKEGNKKNKISSAGFSCGKEGERQKRYKNTNLIPHTSPGHTSSDLGDLGGQWKEILPHWTARP